MIPDRPIIKDESGVERFQRNRIVCLLLTLARTNKVDINELWRWYYDGLFSKEEMQEFYQLIGYSTCSYEEVWEDK